MSGRLFKRGVTVSVAQSTTEYSAKKLVVGPFLPEFVSHAVARVTDTIIIRDLRVVFEIEKNLHSQPNCAKVEVYNLSETSRALFQKRPIAVRVDAGYDGELERLFVGDVRFAESKIPNADWITKIQVADGDRAHRFARITRSYTEGVTVQQAVKDTARAMGIMIDPKTAAKLSGQFASGLSLQGGAAAELTRLLKPKGLTWSIQDGRLQVLAAGDVRSDAPIEVSQDTGLVGSPEYGSPPTKKHPATLNFQMLLYPGLVPGGRVHVKSRAINGLFRIEKVVHRGDTHGHPWHSHVEAKPVNK